MATIYQDSAGILYLGKFFLPNDTSTFKEDLVDLFETDPQNSGLFGSGRLRFSFNGEPVSASEYHVQFKPGGFNSVEVSTSVSSSSFLPNDYRTNVGTFQGTYAVFGKGVIAWFAENNLFVFGEAEVSAFPPPLNRFFLNNRRKQGGWVKFLDDSQLYDFYVDQPEASFSINCSGGGTADATWLKLLDKDTGKAMGVCEGTVMQTEGTGFGSGEVVQVDVPLPDGGSRYFICAGSWGDDGQVLMRIAEETESPI